MISKRLTYFLIACMAIVVGCSTVGHQDFIDLRNRQVGTIEMHKKPYKFKNAGRLIRANFLLGGDGLTHITKNSTGDLVYHYSEQEVLPGFHVKEWVGECLTYDIVDAEDYTIKGWGFDQGGNPLSCRTWP